MFASGSLTSLQAACASDADLGSTQDNNVSGRSISLTVEAALVRLTRSELSLIGSRNSAGGLRASGGWNGDKPAGSTA